MRVTLFRDIPDEKFYSMERYTDALASKLKIKSEKLKIKEFSVRMTKFVRPTRAILRWITVVKDYAFDLYFSRYILYPWLAKKHQGDINHVVDHSYAHLLYHLDPSKTVVTCHDLIPLEYEKDPVALKVWKHSIEGLKKAAMIIADSEATKKDIVTYFSRPRCHPDPATLVNVAGEGSSQNRGGFFGRKLPQNDERRLAEKIRVIHLGVEEKFKPIEDKKLLEAIEKKYNLPEGKRLLHVGNSLVYKNIEGILKAFTEVLHRYSLPSTSKESHSGRLHGGKLFLVKIGSLTDSQIHLAEKLGISERIIQLKDVIEKDLPAIYNVCDVLVMPSHKEGFGFPVLEAMACGLPVVTSKVSSLLEVAGKAAALVNPENHREIAEAAIKILNDKSYQNKLIAAGLKRAKEFSWKKTARETYRVYKEVYSANSLGR